MGERPTGSPKVRQITIDERHAGQRLDNYLLGLLKGVPKSWVYRVVRRGEVRVNKGRSRPDRRLVCGDVVRVPPLRVADRPADAAPSGLARAIEAAVLHEDDRLIVLNKPGGIAVHGGSGVSHGVIEALRASRGPDRFLELVHRLDRETSGCLMIAKRRSALRTLQGLQRDGLIEKRYRALLFGRTRRDEWRVDLPLRKNTLRSGERFVRVDPDGKPAATRFRVVRRFDGLTLVEAELETGRTHQIRVHAAASVGPILGDPKYAEHAEAIERARAIGLRRLFLHAAELNFTWPDAQVATRLVAPLPDDLETVLTLMSEPT
jgi:23S rRNA pseudouridine955/2504/2580 synthase